MKKIGMFLVLFLVGTFIAGCDDSPSRQSRRSIQQQEEIQKEKPTEVPTPTDEELKAQEEKEAQEALQEYANQVVGKIHYLKDPRTNSCFYGFSDISKEPDNLFPIPCNQVPVSLLGVANFDKKEEEKK